MDFASVIKQGEKDYKSDFIHIFNDESSYCFAVADGRETPLGAELAVKTVIADFEETGAVTKTSVPDFLSHADAVLKERKEGLYSSMALMLTDGSVAVWGNIGDCRVYLLRDNWLYEITPDHSRAYSLYEAGRIRYPKIRKQKLRYELTRRLGDELNYIPDFSQPEVIKKDDAFLICTDGFWGNIHERQIEKCLKKSKSAQDWLDKMMLIVDKNIRLKKYTRFKDSMTAITIKM